MDQAEQNIPYLTEGRDNWDTEPRAQSLQTGSALDQIKTNVADQLQTMAQMLHKKVSNVDQPNDLTNLGQRAADWLDRSADYVSEMQPQRLRTDVENHVRRNPGRSLLIAGAAGLVLARLLRRR